MTLKVFLAARYSRLPEMLDHAADLEAEGMSVTSQWIRCGHETPDHEIPFEWQALFAQDDLGDIDAADIVIAFTDSAEDNTSRGGKSVELGYAIAKGKGIVVCGPREHIFHALPQIVRVETWDHALHLLRTATSMVMKGWRDE